MKAVRPKVIYILWLIVFPILSVPFAILKGLGHSGGEQVEIETLATCVNVYVYGTLLLFIATPFLFPTWFGKRSLLIVLLFSIFAFLAVLSILNH